MLDKRKIIEEWFERAKHDIEGARLLFKEGHFTDTIAHLIQQAVEKYSSSFMAGNSKKFMILKNL